MTLEDATRLQLETKLLIAEEQLLIKESEIAELNLSLSKVKKQCETLENLKAHLILQLCDLKKNDGSTKFDPSQCSCLCHLLKNKCNAETQTFETDFNYDGISGSMQDWYIPEGSEKTVADLVKDVTSSLGNTSDYVYDENTKLYYSASANYFYDPESQMFIEARTGVRYVYDSTNQLYQLYTEPLIQKKKKKKKKVAVEGEDFPEEGEIVSSESEDSDSGDEAAAMDIQEADEELAHRCTPCIRAIVQESSSLKPGSLLLIPVTGAIIGREPDCGICIADQGISKTHAEISYQEDERVFKIKDLGSQNGTVLNTKRLSESKCASECQKLSHEDILELGPTCRLLLHIHRGQDTCDGCEPGQVQAGLSQQEVKPQEEFKVLTKEEREKERKQIVKQLKKKYSLQAMDYESHLLTNIEKLGYKDRSEQRRVIKGSDNPYEKTEIPSSLERSLPEDNKGYQLLQKMGWSQGQGLGKSQQGENLEPISLSKQIGTTGFGAMETINPKSSNLQGPIHWKKSKEILISSSPKELSCENKT